MYLTPSPFSSDGYEQSLLSASVEKEVTRSREEEEGRGGEGGRGEKEKDGLRILGLVQTSIAASYNLVPILDGELGMQRSLVPILDGDHGMRYSHSGWGGYSGVDLIPSRMGTRFY